MIIQLEQNILPEQTAKLSETNAKSLRYSTEYNTPTVLNSQEIQTFRLIDPYRVMLDK